MDPIREAFSRVKCLDGREETVRKLAKYGGLLREANLAVNLLSRKDMDDVEYGLRNNLPIITLNGINVWHLYKKALVNAKNDYYDIRNRQH